MVKRLSFLIKSMGRYMEKFMGHLIPESAEKRYDDYLVKARMNTNGSSYLSFSIVISIIAFVAFALASIFSYLYIRRSFLIIFSFSFLFFALILYVVFSYPEIKINEIRRNVEKNFPSFLSSMYALSMSGMPVNDILSEIAENEGFGEIAEEIRRVSVRINILGMDLVRALEASEKETPSRLLASIFTGIRISLISNRDIIAFLKEKADYYQKVNDSRLKISLETLGIATESFVAVVIAFPILLYITVSIISLKNQNTEFFTISMALTLIFFMAFYFVIRKTAGEIQ
ncbi:MAG: type II secretion system F family protein [Thermoplasmata archaeon]